MKGSTLKGLLKPPIKHPLLLPAILVLFYLSLCVITFLNWQRNNWFPIGGDEQAYLLLADSILRDGSLEITSSLHRQVETRSIIPWVASIDQAAQVFHGAGGKNGIFSAHNFGLPLLLILPYAVGGTLAVKLSLILLSSLIVVLGWIISGCFTQNTKVRVMSVVAATFGLPFIPASNQIYPDLIAGIIALSAITLLMVGGGTSKKAEIAEIFVGLAIALLPLLQIKFSACAVVLALSLSYRIYRKTKSIARSIGFLFYTVASLAVVLVYNKYAFGSFAGYYGGAAGSLEVSWHAFMVFLGLHLDRFQGILIQNPAYFIGLFFLIPFLKKDWLLGVAIILAYGSFILPNSLHPNWYGGGSFAGRFAWSGAALILPVVIFGLSTSFLYLRKKAVYLFSLLCFLQAHNYTVYTFSNFPFYNKTGFFDLPWPDEYQSFYPLIKNFLPIFYDSRWAYTHPQNIIFLVLCLGLISFGSAYAYGIKNLRKSFFIFIAGAFLSIVLFGLFAPPPTLAKPIPSISLSSQIGKNDGDSRVATEATDPAGFLTYGPFWKLGSGWYELTVNYSADTTSLESVGWVEIFFVEFNRVVATKDIAISKTPSELKIKFDITDELINSPVEFRTYYKGHGTLTINSMSLMPITHD